MLTMKNLLPLLVLAALAHTAHAAAIPDPPALDVKSYALLDFASGQLLAGKEPDTRVEPASITKVMTVYVAFDEIKHGHLHLDDQALISEKAWREGKDSSESRMFVDVGSHVKIEDLLRGIIIQSGNDATVALAEHIAGSEATFAEMMNQYAKKLGMANTHFVDASGMPDAQHYTTARDLTLLGRALIRDFPEQYKIFSEREFVFHNIRQGNRNILLDMDPTVDGIKTGHTSAAGYCLLASSVRDGRRLISAVMGDTSTKERANSSRALLGYGFRFFETVQIFGPAQPAAKAYVWKGSGPEVPLGVAAPVSLTLPRGARAQLQFTPVIDGKIVAPVAAGQKVGTVSVTLDGKTLRTDPLVALQDAPEGTLWQRVVDSVRLLIGK